MAIRYDESLNKEIRRIVNNYNAKIRRLDKQNNITLPKKFDNMSLKSLKQSVDNRADLRRRLKELQRFSSRGGEKIIKVKGKEIPKYQYQNIKAYQSLIRRRLNQKRKFYQSKQPTTLGQEMDSFTYAQLQERDWLNILAKEDLLLNKDILNLSVKERENFIDLLRKNSKTFNFSRWQNNYLKILLDTGEVYQVEDYKIKELQRKLSNLTPNQFNNLFSTERTIQQIIYYYKALEDLGIDLASENLTEDMQNLFDNLYKNIDVVLKDYV